MQPTTTATAHHAAGCQGSPRSRPDHRSVKKGCSYTYGSSAQRPKLTLVQVVFGEVAAEGPSIVNDSDFKAEIELDGTVWPSDSPNTAKPKRRRFTLH